MNPVPLRRLLQVFNDAYPCGYETHDGRRYHFETPEGAHVVRPVLGDFWVAGSHRYCPWTNCDATRLVVMIPSDAAGAEDPHEWSPHNRASNCTQKSETTHRCWVLHGDPERPETLHVDKDGVTCEAGGGSIQFGDFHGYVNNGRVTTVHESRGRRAEEDLAPRVVRAAETRGGRAVLGATSTRILSVPAVPVVPAIAPAHPVIPRSAQRRGRAP